MAKEDLRAELEAQGVSFDALEGALRDVVRQVIVAGATQVRPLAVLGRAPLSRVWLQSRRRCCGCAEDTGTFCCSAVLQIAAMTRRGWACAESQNGVDAATQNGLGGSGRVDVLSEDARARRADTRSTRACGTSVVGPLSLALAQANMACFFCGFL